MNDKLEFAAAIVGSIEKLSFQKLKKKYNDAVNNSRYTINRKKNKLGGMAMKKTLSKMFACCLVLILLIGCRDTGSVSKNALLDEIANKFNACETVLLISEAGTPMTATTKKKKIILTAIGAEDTTEVEFVLNGTILSTSIYLSENEDLTKPIMALALVDCIGQINGYADGDTMLALNSGDLNEYTVEDDGLEVTTGDNNVEMKIDLSKKFLLIQKDVPDNTGILQSIDDKISSKNNMFQYKNFEWKIPPEHDIYAMLWAGMIKNISDEPQKVNIHIKFYDIDKNCIGETQFRESITIDEGDDYLVIQPNEIGPTSFSFNGDDLYEEYVVRDVAYISIEDIVSN